MKGTLETVKLLISKGANIMATNDIDNTPLHYGNQISSNSLNFFKNLKI
jgi:hypothetical protein